MDKFVIKTKRKNTDDTLSQNDVPDHEGFGREKRLHIDSDSVVNETELSEKMDAHKDVMLHTSDVFETPNKPTILPRNFPIQVFKGRTLKFQNNWVKKFPWLHLNPSKPDAGIFCFYCSIFLDKNPEKILVKRMEDAFTIKGFSNWKKAIEKFQSHQNAQSHKIAVQSLKQISDPIENQLSDICRAEKEKNMHCIKKIASSVKFLAKQGLAFRGHDPDSGNFIELMKLRANDDEELLKWMKKDRENFLDGKIQNKIIELFSRNIIKNICSEIKSQDPPIFSMICDGTRDISGEDQLSLCFRWIDKDFYPHESFVGLYSVQKTRRKYCKNNFGYNAATSAAYIALTGTSV